jgi:hypothetical protein
MIISRDDIDPMTGEDAGAGGGEAGAEEADLPGL